MDSLKGKRVFVGLSGGVDSAVSAMLLKQAGADVTGVFIKGWYPPGLPCSWSEDRQDAMRAAAHLGIPFHTLDASHEYKKGVIDYLLSEYSLGRTPNPDVMCNREVKFGAFWRFAEKHRADFVGTGHYAQNKDGKILRGLDEHKDQSYFLWAVPQEALARTLFPVGSFEKAHTRLLAAKFGIPLAEKKDSQGICFLGSISVDEFLKSEIDTESGKAVDEQGKDVGIHEGAVLATLGERVQLTGALPGPWYVLRKNMQENVLVVGHAPVVPQVESKHVRLRETNWLAPLQEGVSVSAQYRYHGPRIAGSLSMQKGVFTPDSPILEPVAPGQSLVCYQGNQLLGGGIIE